MLLWVVCSPYLLDNVRLAVVCLQFLNGNVLACEETHNVQVDDTLIRDAKVTRAASAVATQTLTAAAGASPCDSLKMFFMRSTILRQPSGISSPMSQVWKKPSSSAGGGPQNKGGRGGGGCGSDGVRSGCLKIHVRDPLHRIISLLPRVDVQALTVSHSAGLF